MAILPDFAATCRQLLAFASLFAHFFETASGLVREIGVFSRRTLEPIWEKTLI